jgi:hypothetical protein
MHLMFLQGNGSIGQVEVSPEILFMCKAPPEKIVYKIICCWYGVRGCEIIANCNWNWHTMELCLETERTVKGRQASEELAA